MAGTPCYWIPLVACPGSTSAWRASSFSLRRDPCCGPGWAFRTGSSVWQHRQVAISGVKAIGPRSMRGPKSAPIRSKRALSRPKSVQMWLCSPHPRFARVGVPPDEAPSELEIDGRMVVGAGPARSRRGVSPPRSCEIRQHHWKGVATVYGGLMSNRRSDAGLDRQSDAGPVLL